MATMLAERQEISDKVEPKQLDFFSAIEPFSGRGKRNGNGISGERVPDLNPDDGVPVHEIYERTLLRVIAEYGTFDNKLVTALTLEKLYNNYDIQISPKEMMVYGAQLSFEHGSVLSRHYLDRAA